MVTIIVSNRRTGSVYRERYDNADEASKRKGEIEAGFALNGKMRDRRVEMEFSPLDLSGGPRQEG